MKEEQEGPPNRELYALLHISPEASDEEIRKAYRQWAQVYHPDKYQAPHVCYHTYIKYSSSFFIRPLICLFIFIIAPPYLCIFFLSKPSSYWVCFGLFDFRIKFGLLGFSCILLGFFP